MKALSKKVQKSLAKLQAKASSFDYNEACWLLDQLGYEKKEGDGSRVSFTNPVTGGSIKFHRPHNAERSFKVYILNDLIKLFKEDGII